MTKKSVKTYQQLLKLTMWFFLFTGLSALSLFAGFYLLESVLLLSAGIMFGPIFALLTVIFALLTLFSWLSLRK